MSADSHLEGLAQVCSNSSALAMELLQSCAKPSIYSQCDMAFIELTHCNKSNMAYLRQFW